MLGMGERYLGLVAGPYHVGLPLVAVRQILDAGEGGAPTDPRALGVEPIPLASVLGAEPHSLRPALLLFDGQPGPLLLSSCSLTGVLEPEEVRPLPGTVATRWPGLVRGTLRQKGLVLLLDPQVLVGLMEAYSSEDRAEPPEAADAWEGEAPEVPDREPEEEAR